jgi:hypothetical protein
MVGGDGLLFEKMVQLKHYLQFHPNAFQSFQLIHLMLELCISNGQISVEFTRHIGEQTAAPKIQVPCRIVPLKLVLTHKVPTKLSKVDYYPYLQLSYLVLDVCMLDCWQ